MKTRVFKPPLFEVGPKAYMCGSEMFKLAEQCDLMSRKYDVSIILTPQSIDIRGCAERTSDLFVFAQHMDPIKKGRGLGSILPDAVKEAGAKGVMLNHAEKPINYSTLEATIARAKELDLLTIACANTLTEGRAIALLGPDAIIVENPLSIGTGIPFSVEACEEIIAEVKKVNPDVFVFPGAGIKNGQDVYNVMISGADGTGSTSGIMNAEDQFAMLEEMIKACRDGWETAHPNEK